jgi:hypothetical protein
MNAPAPTPSSLLRLGWVKVALRSGETGWLRRGDVVPLYRAPQA